MSVPLTSLPISDRPRERLAQLGAQALADAELVAIQLGPRSAGPGDRAP